MPELQPFTIRTGVTVYLLANRGDGWPEPRRIGWRPFTYTVTPGTGTDHRERGRAAALAVINDAGAPTEDARYELHYDTDGVIVS